MIDNTSKQLESTSDNLVMGSIGAVLDIIDAALAVPEPPLTPLPPPLLLLGSNLRSGVSADAIVSRIISRMHEAGLPEGDVFNDGPNSLQQIELIRIQEIIYALMNEAKIEIAIPPGISVTTVGIGNLGAPVLSYGQTTSLVTASGVIR